MDSTSRTLVAGVESAQLRLGATIVTGVSITVAAADISVILYDNTSAATPIFQYDSVFDIDAMDKSVYIELPNVKCLTGLWAAVTGVGAVVYVHYK